ncbi:MULTISPECIES: hypothetical protein [Hafniaceae]|uniref:hypothetical protein n=1 Tax=Hafniaceae TaxID=1903412 RepID=UPI0014129D52|nr:MULTISPECIES: hypothetical protein [Hafniaceae]MCE9886316.1 hypothetical protein [Obesumbacterium proteus]MCE9915707.1 hypothetical protein [Obesumbacterium proteus]MCE9931922.1 hypothetical protein [Obesumbacterium proteus]MCG2878692.1 hypothetical protein [Obesumbacterium proteus]QIP55040.1 hypothetical protein HBA19_05135 [Hafnia alvei]
MKMIKYVWGIFEYLPPVPNKNMFTNAQGACFYPFEHQGDIFTIDSDLWVDSVVEANYYPNSDVIRSEITSRDNTPDNKTIKLIAFYSKPSVSVLGSIDNVTLLEISHKSINALKSNYYNIGFDVVDITGLSGLANIGFDPEQLSDVDALKIKMSRWGLVVCARDAKKLAELFSILAPEHAPFIYLEIWMKKSKVIPKSI